MAELQDVPSVGFAIALFIGALVGLEREKKLEEEERRSTGGLRTFILIALAGAVSAWLSQRLGAPWIFLGAGLLVTAAVLTGYVAYARAERDYGITTEIAAVVVYLLGGTTLFGHPAPAVALAIVTSAVLAFKQPLHGVVGRIGREDIYAGLKLLIASFIVLPVLPNRPIDPWQALNPYEMWLLVILISGLSLVGYAASRWLGPGRGIPLTGLLGGLVSSTAVTLSLARRSREKPPSEPLAAALAAGILLAWAVTFVRVVVEVAVVHGALVPRVALAMGTLAAIPAAFALASVRRIAAPRPPRELEVPLSNPFSLSFAIRFALLLAVVLLAVELARRRLSAGGVYAVAALAGLGDVDAVTLSMARSARDGGDAAVAVRAIVIAALANSAAKAGIVFAFGMPALRRPAGAATAAVLLAGAVLLAI